MAIYANLTVDQGSTFTATIDVVDSEGSALDLTGYTYFGQIRKNYKSSTAVDFTIAAAPGGIELVLSSTQTDAMKPGRYLYDVEIVSPGGEITRVVEGQLEITPSITRQA